MSDESKNSRKLVLLLVSLIWLQVHKKKKKERIEKWLMEKEDKRSKLKIKGGLEKWRKDIRGKRRLTASIQTVSGLYILNEERVFEFTQIICSKWRQKEKIKIKKRIRKVVMEKEDKRSKLKIKGGLEKWRKEIREKRRLTASIQTVSGLFILNEERVFEFTQIICSKWRQKEKIKIKKRIRKVVMEKEDKRSKLKIKGGLEKWRKEIREKRRLTASIQTVSGLFILNEE